ncbi:oxygen-independent coproporphyrinogen-3 oxidase [Salsuginibacillus halophilus]|uniref:Heme chaperone HemW n=1 Tax=Salsuginibacillus halophilus TaxID=517424 RepID=A0A2P8HFN3_9BACI|nr:radical SAM family heme chaperone HemW [Salsuginibacillus halophilus]PSL45037.1 oxygen-independent coproporphyrinogen-3 oxidase [Salsuginibacillus halophilus]
MARSLYIHIPFCSYICYYCDFNKFFIENQPVDAYIDALEQELTWRFAGETAPLETIYIGGGTPSAVTTAQLGRILQAVHVKTPGVSPGAEFTVEMNPDDADDDKLHTLFNHGVNRLSIGVQTFDDKLIQKIGRGHTASDAKNAVHRAKAFNFSNISIDLMLGLPEQTMSSWHDTLQTAAALDVSHISAYALKIEEKTRFYNWWRAGKLPTVTEDEAADMYEAMERVLADAGFHQYEISNFAKDGQASRHNQVYWHNESYVAAGAGAHGYLQGARYENIQPVPHYISAIENGELPERQRHQLSRREQMEEEMFLGLRMNEGMPLVRFEQKYGETVADAFPGALEELTAKGWLTVENGWVALTEEGRLLGNEVFVRFLENENKF